jgi:hypothetical protein
MATNKMQTEQSLLTPAYTKFFAQFSEIETLPVSSWKIVHLVSYFVKRYKAHYDVDYTMRMNHKSVSKCYEVWQISKLTQMMTKNPEILKDYIDWIFDKKVIAKKKRITSLAIFTDADNINEYKWNVLNAKHIDRSTKLPEKYMEVIRKIDDNINTFGDLVFAQRSTNVKYVDMIQSLVNIGLKIEDLKKVK